jgi:Fic family protein
MSPLEKAAILFEELESLRPFSGEDEQRIMQKFRLDWNYHSNHIEGNQLTYGETKALLLFNITAQGKPLKDHIEMTGHNEAINWILEILKDERRLNETFIRQLHKLLLKEPYEVDAITPEGKPTKRTIKVGQYKSAANHVKTKTGEIFRFASVEETPAKMYDLLEWFSEEKDRKAKNTIILAAEFHYKFIRIHPFDDGNGRMARILMNFILMSNSYPPVVIKTEDKENYFAVLQLADAGQFTPYVEYIADNLNHSIELMIRGAKGEEIEEEDDLEKEIILLQTKLNEVGSVIKYRKSQETITNFFNRNIEKVFNAFHSKNQLFNRYYVKHDYSIQINERIVKYPDSIPDFNGNFGFRNETPRFTITSLFQQFKTEGFDSFSFQGIITFEFKDSNIEYFSNYHDGSIIRSIRYNEDLTNKEIDQLVTPIILGHKSRIEERIESLKNKNIR